MAYTIKACESYDQSLRQLNKDLLNVTIATSDATLCAILVMGLYEVRETLSETVAEQLLTSHERLSLEQSPRAFGTRTE